MPRHHPTQQLNWSVRTVALTLLSILFIVSFSAAVVLAKELFLTLALGILFSVFLTKTSLWISGKLGFKYGYALATLTTLLVVATIVGCFFFGFRVNQQVDKASKHLDQAQSRLQELADMYPTLRAGIASTPFVRELLEEPVPFNGSRERADSKAHLDNAVENAWTDSSNAGERRNAPPSTPRDINWGMEQEGKTTESGSDSGAATRPKATESIAIKNVTSRAIQIVGSVFKTTFGLVINSMLIFFVGLFVATSPESYRDGIVILFPEDRRARTTDILNMLGDVLWRWLIGRFGSMLVTGVGAGVLLGLLGVPMSATLAIITALLTFVPNIGGFIALMLAILFAVPQGGMTILWVVIGYLGLQLIESYVVTPLIQQKQVSIPPALLIAFQAIMGVLFGFLGAAVASPMLAAAKVFIEEAYVKDVLEAKAL